MHTTNERLEWNSWNGHLVHSEEDAYLLHVPTTAVFGVDALGLSVIDHCRESGGHSVDELVALLAGRFAPGRVRAFAAELRQLEMLQPSGSLKPINPGQRQGEFLSLEHPGAEREYRVQFVVHLLLQGRSGEAGRSGERWIS